MKSLLILWAIAACTRGHDTGDVQISKSLSVKGSPSRYIYKGGENIGRFYNTRQHNVSKHTEVDIGVCYIEVPTAELVSDPKNVPPGNGSNPAVSLIRACCHGFTRNIHDYMVCDPVCSKGCVNSLCVAPETCQCYPDFVKNANGVCTATCPIGCQNGHCVGRACVCDSGYKLDSESKYCKPICDNNCGNIGNCTAPNTCSCEPGYHSASQGSCKPVCQYCKDGEECTAPNRCSCRNGYIKDTHGKCVPYCASSCQSHVADHSSQHNDTPFIVVPLYAENINHSSYPHTNLSQNLSPYNPNYPQGPRSQYSGNNNENYYSRNLSNRSHDLSADQDQTSQIQQRPDNSFHTYQRPLTYPEGQNLQGKLPNNTNPAPGQESNQYPINLYPGFQNTPENLHRGRGDIETENDKKPGQVQTNGQTSSNNSFHMNTYPNSNIYPYYQGSDTRGRHQNNSMESINRYESDSHGSSNQGLYFRQDDNNAQQELHDFRNLETIDLTQHESNQRSYDASQHHDHQYDNEYTQSNYGYFNHDTQLSLSQHQTYPGSNQDIHHEAYDSSKREIQNTANERKFNLHQELHRNSRNHQRNFANSSSQQESYISSRREIQNSTNVGNYDSRWETYSPNQSHPLYSIENPRQTPEVSNQVVNRTANSSHTNVQGNHTFDIDQQVNIVPVCSKPCINSYCVEGNQCRCKPGYLMDRSDPNTSFFLFLSLFIYFISSNLVKHKLYYIYQNLYICLRFVIWNLQFYIIDIKQFKSTVTYTRRYEKSDVSINLHLSISTSCNRNNVSAKIKCIFMLHSLLLVIYVNMKRLFILWAVSVCVHGYTPGNSVKGGPTWSTPEPDPYTRPETETFIPNKVDEIGVCYTYMPNKSNGGQQPEYNTVRSCCRGYTPNRYDPNVCDPICSKGCVNSYCVAPDKCQCYPDYEEESPGVCAERALKCPRGCQNGHCSRDECICDFGYKWDSDRQRCVPKCKYNCAGLGTCTAPNTCSCRPGYQSTAEGSCERDSQGNSRPLCHSACPHNSVCIGPNLCSSPTTSVESQNYVRPNNVRSNRVDNYQQHLSYVDRDSYYQQNQNHQYTDDHQNLYNPYGSQSQDTYNQRFNYESQDTNRPHESYDHRNQGYGNPDSTHQPNEYYNQKSNESQRTYDSQYSQHVDRAQSSTSQYNDEYRRNQNTHDSSHQRPYDSPRRETESVTQRSYNSHQESYGTNQRPYSYYNSMGNPTTSEANKQMYTNQYNTEYGWNQNTNQERNQNTHDSSHQRPYDSSRRETESVTQRNYNSHQESYGTNQRPYFYYNSMDNPSTSEAHNQHGSRYTDQGYDQRSVPVCSMYCINGHCVEGNQCSCNPGYIPDKTNPSVCQPECPGGCVNGVCSAPRLCLCNAGYYKDKGVKGQICVKRISLGRKVDRVKKVCCAYNNHSSFHKQHLYLNRGFLKGTMAYLLEVCLVIFIASVVETKALDNGLCHRYEWKTVTKEVSSPYIVRYKKEKCFFNCYRTKTEYRTRIEQQRVLYKKVECCKGYMQNGTTELDSRMEEILKCDPICEPPCGERVCVSPNTCVCPAGYTFNNETCVAVCSEPCVYGACIKPDTCGCYPGYTMIDGNECTPICSKSCRNGICIGPDVCQCGDGWELINENICMPICTVPCNNGTCVAPDTCECEIGYKFENGTCMPLCSEPCNNGICVEPEICECLPGYWMTDDNKCKAVCSKGCQNGNCISPDFCQCDDGFELIKSTCMPKCESCYNGTCVTPNNCKCNEGYGMKDGRCQPVCSETCYDGYCVDMCNKEEQNLTTTIIYNTDLISRERTDEGISVDNLPRGNFTDWDENTDVDENIGDFKSITNSTNVNSESFVEISSLNWIYYFVIPAVALMTIITAILIWKRKSIVEHCTGGSYIVAGDKNTSSKDDNIPDIKFSAIMEKKAKKDTNGY
ncbi:uncharacterized protein LOC128671428 [Plodia interpunctella]|uniref:uncharacterized protein LOC128671428 n=1 Tax=Plodia interpunctella TaxID=58824 RepID=UPI0031019E78